MSKSKENLRALCESAIMIAFATVLGFLKFPPFRFDVWLFGGSIDFVMLPLFILAWRRGAKWAIPAGFAFGLIKCAIGEAFGWGILSILLDYVLAYAVVGVAGFFKGKKYGLEIGCVVGSVARFLVHFVSGITIYAIAVGETAEIFGMSFGADQAWLYSIIYNGSYMLGEMLYCLALAIPLKFALKKLPL